MFKVPLGTDAKIPQRVDSKYIDQYHFLGSQVSFGMGAKVARLSKRHITGHLLMGIVTEVAFVSTQCMIWPVRP